MLLLFVMDKDSERGGEDCEGEITADRTSLICFRSEYPPGCWIAFAIFPGFKKISNTKEVIADGKETEP